MMMGGFDSSPMHGIGITAFVCLDRHERFLLQWQAQLRSLGFDFAADVPSVARAREIMADVSEHPTWLFSVGAREAVEAP